MKTAWADANSSQGVKWVFMLNIILYYISKGVGEYM